MAEYGASIIVPLLVQKDEWLEQCILSALQQTVPCQTVVVISPHTPGSNLNLLNQLKEGYTQLLVVPQDPDTGLAEAINLGLRTASTDRVGLLLSDDWLERHTVASCMAYDSDIVCTGMTIFHEDGEQKICEKGLSLTTF